MQMQLAELPPRRRQKHSAPGQPEITFGWEPFAFCVREARPMLAREAAEVQTDKRLPYDPDWDRLFGWAASGSLDVWTVRAELTLIGYASVLFMPHLYSRDVSMVNVHTPYLAPEWRQGWLGFEMLEALCEALRERRVNIMDVDLPADSRLHRIFDRMKFTTPDVRRRLWL